MRACVRACVRVVAFIMSLRNAAFLQLISMRIEHLPTILFGSHIGWRCYVYRSNITHTHASTHTHARTYARTHTHARTHARTHKCANIQICLRECTRSGDTLTGTQLQQRNVLLFCDPGMPYALKQAGFGLGILLVILVTGITGRVSFSHR